MADNDDEEMTLGGSGPYPTDSESEEPPEPAPPAQPAQAESSEGAPEDPNTAKQRAAVLERLQHNYEQMSGREQEGMAQIGKEIQRLTEAANAPPPKPPVPYALPAPPNEQHKGGASEFIANLLKFGALTAIAFGTGRRGYAHGAIWKGAIGAAIDGYYSGRKDITDRAMQLWEKNRAAINQMNKQQMEQYHANLKDSRLALNQRLAINRDVAQAYRDYRTWESAKNQNLNEQLRALDDQEKVHKDNVRWQRQQWDKIYNILGKPNQTAQYWAWVNEQSKGKINITHASSEEEIEKAEKEYPPYEFLKHQEEEDLRKLAERTTIAEKARVKGKHEEEQREKEEEAKQQGRIHPGGTKDNPLGLNLGSE